MNSKFEGYYPLLYLNGKDNSSDGRMTITKYLELKKALH